MRRALLAAALLLAGCATSSRATYRTHDLMPLYWSFAERAQNASMAEQIQLARELVVRKRPDIYNEKVLLVDPESKKFEEWYPKYYAWVSPHFDVMRRLSETVARDMKSFDARFRRQFPDFAFDGDVYFLNSFGAFDGALRTVNGRTVLLFGLETLAAVHGGSASVEPLFDHELFHLYHRQFFKAAEDEPLWVSLWREGLATYVARRMNPDATDRQIHGLPDTTPARVRANLPHVAQMFFDRIDSKSPDDESLFFLGNKPADADPPARSGYYIGFLIAEKLGRHRSLADLAKLPAEDVRLAIEGQLRAMASGRD